MRRRRRSAREPKEQADEVQHQTTSSTDKDFQQVQALNMGNLTRLFAFYRARIVSLPSSLTGDDHSLLPPTSYAFQERMTEWAKTLAVCFNN